MNGTLSKMLNRRELTKEEKKKILDVIKERRNKYAK